MSFYETNNASIIRFAVHNPAKRVIAPFSNLKRIAAFSNIGTGQSAFSAANALAPELLQNGSLIIKPTSGANNDFTLPSAYNLQEYLSGRGAFNFDANNTGSNDFFVINVYNLGTTAGIFHAYDNASQKTITAAAVLDDAVLTPVLIQFSNVNSSYATVDGSPNAVSYTVL
jgi:hypothetical protein